MVKTDTLKNTLTQDDVSVLDYLRTKFPLFHNSNVFFRDLQYGIKNFFENKEINIKRDEAEVLARNFVQHLEDKGIFKRINDQTWKLNYPEYVTTKIGDPL